MFKKTMLCIGAFFSYVVIVHAGDAEGCKDHPMLSRMKNFVITECEKKEFGQEEMYVGADQTKTVEGKVTTISYERGEGTAAVSEVQVKRNYVNAVTRLGGALVYEETYDAYLKFEKKGSEIWVRVQVYDGAMSYKLYIVEVEVMKQEVTAADMLSELNNKGFVALYINFDTDKATIKPESQPILDQIVALLTENADLKVSIEGHTDNTGTAKHNKTLSEQRAKSVVDAVVKGGIDAKRLGSKGWGQEKPMADNKTEEGKARNRRVEIVKQ